MTSDEAIAFTRSLAAERGWPMLEPVHAERRRPWWVMAPRWIVVSNWGSRGSSVRVEIDDRTGKVLLQGYLPR
jgi:hypothetical protein